MFPTDPKTDKASDVQSLREALVEALERPGHHISPIWFYDQRGSELFEEITKLPSYYLARTEIKILDDNLEEISKVIGADRLVIELGSGSSRKTLRLLEALEQPAGYVPVDISADYLLQAAASLSKKLPSLPVMALVADFTTMFSLPLSLPPHRSRLGFFPGSTVGNLEVAEVLSLLTHCHKVFGDEAAFLIGVDLDKSPEVLISAYDDPEGVTAEFNRNLLKRINRELGLEIDPRAFAHQARYFTDPARIEMHLVAIIDQKFEISGRTYTLAAGESFHTETSHKYTIESFSQLAEKADWEVTQYWCDTKKRFAVLLLEAAACR
ncbi:MAG: L-histidine N(alpha)-methyltransferase [Gammaproteobacteria bacterium]|nr:L-histidine N(alpha)-methyltransferase [Gammaproteobacteria bacterium]|tara:strand:+ start:400 stop:1371 length:972 start_codon:yes stop_codon:yes gene_type:complete